MGTSSASVISPIIMKLRGKRILNVLDVGIGESGQWAHLMRDKFDSTMVNAHFSNPFTWKINIVGIEICKEYHNPVHDYLYDKIYWCDVWDAFKEMSQTDCAMKYDVIFFTSTIEHFPKADGERLVKELKRYLENDGVLVMTTPNGYEAQPPTDNNPNDEHLCGWDIEDFKRVASQCNYRIDWTKVTDDNRLIVFLKRNLGGT